MSVATQSRTRPVYLQGKWDLGALLPSAAEEVVSARIAEIDRGVEELEGWRERLGGLDSTSLRALLVRHEALFERIGVLGGFASLKFAEDTQSNLALNLRNRVQQALMKAENRLLFLALWWKGLDDERAEELLAGLAGEPDRSFFLRDLRRLRPHTLDERSEQIVNLKDADGIGGVLTAYSILTNRLEFTLQTPEGPRAVPRDQLMAEAYSPVAERRQAALRELYRVYSRESMLLGQLYGHRVRDWHNENIGLRHYPSPISVRNVANDIPDTAVEALLEVCAEEAPVFQRYFRWKQGKLYPESSAQCAPLSRYDLYAPICDAAREIEFPRAADLVLDTFYDFDPRLGLEAERVFADGHLDSELRKGKKGGAFCATVLPRLTPWVLVNYTGRVRDVATLAHELGHAVHSLLASEHDVFTQHACLPLAETASVFAEILVTHRLLREEVNPAVRRELLAAALDDMYATVLRQAWFTRFEIEAHAAVLAGRSTEELSQLYLRDLRAQFGDSVEVPAEFADEWVTIPHIYQTPFYCYAYSFGQLLVLSLFSRYLEDGERFKPGYFKLLAHGGSGRPLEILAQAGVDPTDRGFWRGGFEVIRNLVAEIEGL